MLNINALKDFGEELGNRSTGTGVLMYQKDIKEETDVRILPPTPQMQGMYFVEAVTYWIARKKYICPSTFGGESIIEAKIAEAKATGDPEILALLNDKDEIKRVSDFYIPILTLSVEQDEHGGVANVAVNGEAKILVCGSMLMKRINKVVTSRKFINGTPNGITDRVKGFNLILSKVGEKLNTEYDATGDVQWELPASYYASYPDVRAYVENSIYPDDYLAQVMDNFIYGDALPEAPKLAERLVMTGAEAVKETAEEAPKRATSRRAAPKEEAEEQPKEEAAPKRASRVATAEAKEEAKPAKKSSFAERLRNLD